MSNRYFLFQNPFNKNMIYTNIDFYGGDTDIENENYFIKIPFLCLRRYNNTVSENSSRIEGAMYYIKQFDKLYVELSEKFVGINPFSFTYLNNKPVFFNYEKTGYLYWGKSRNFPDSSDIQDEWLYAAYNFDYDFQNFLYDNIQKTLDSDFDGTSYGEPVIKPNHASMAYRPNITGNPSLGNIYTSRTDTGSNAGNIYYVYMFYFGNTQLYTRAEDAVDLTPSDKREFSYDVAGKWINKSGEKIYIGTPVFKFQSGDLSALCYACRNTSYKKENFILPIEGDDEHQNEIQRERTILADTFDGSGYLYEEIVETKKRWTGTNYYISSDTFYVFGFDQQEENGGYWKTTNIVTKNKILDEDIVADSLVFVSIDDSINKENMTITYSGSTIEKNLLQKSDTVFQQNFKQYVFKNPSVNYHYDIKDKEDETIL